MGSTRPKVAIIHQPWSVVEPPVRSADSIALWTDEVAHRLIKSCDVTCYSRLWKGQGPEQTLDGIRYSRKSVSIDKWIRGGFTWLDEKGFGNKHKPFYASSLCYRQFIGGVIADLKANPVDIVHIQNFSQFAPMIRAALPNVRIMLHMHAEWLAMLDRKMIGRRIRDIDSIIFCSNYFAQQTRDAWPEYAHLCHTVYNGVTMSEFEGVQPAAKAPGVKRILFVSRVSPDKGVHVLVDAFNKIVQKYPKAELKIVGPWAMLPKSFCLDHSNEKIMQDLRVFYDGLPFNDQLRQRMSPQAAPQVEITGPIPREDLVRMFHSADVLTLPSIYPEGFGMPIAEAGACGVPAVVARRGGMPEVVEDGKTGFIVESANVDALADALIRMFDDEPKRQAMGRAALKRVQDHFTWERIADSLLSEYNRMLESPKNENLKHAPVVAH